MAPASSLVESTPHAEASQAPAAPAPGMLSDREWIIIKITSLAHFLCHLGELIFPGVMLAVRDELHLSATQTTDLAVLGYVLMGAGALPVGWWTDAWGSRRVLLVYFFAMTVAGLAVAAAPSAELLFAALTLLGLATSMYHPAGLAMLSLGVEKRGRALGINGVAGSIGIALGPALGLVASSLGFWQGAYLVLAALASLAGLIAIRDLRRLPTEATRGADIPGCPAGIGRQENLAHERARSWVPFVLLLLVMLGAGFNYRCLMTSLPSYLSEGNDFIKGGIYIFVITLVGGSIGQLVGGALSDRWGARRVYLFLVAALVPLSLLLGAGRDINVAALVAGLLAVALFAQQPVENSLLAECTSRGRRSISYGAKFVLTFGVGALGTTVVGIVWQESGSFHPVFYLMALTSCLMAGLLVIFLCSGHRMSSAGR